MTSEKCSIPQEIFWFPIWLLLGSATYLYLNLFTSFHTPFLLGGDQVFFWMDAQRMLDGEKVYQDFFQFTPPGTDFIYFALFKLFGPYLWVTNAVVLALGVALCWICFSVANESMDSCSALLATFLFLVLIYGKLLNGTHHWFSVLAVMCAVKMSMRDSTPVRMLLTGAVLGLASFFTQTRGVMALLALVGFLVWERSRMKKPWIGVLRNQALLFLGFSAALLLLSSHLIATGGLKQLWYFQVTYVRQYMLHETENPSMGLPAQLAWHALPKLSQYLFIYILLPVVYLLAFWRCRREQHHPLFPWRQVALLSMVGLLLLLEVTFSLNWLRLYTVSMPGIILFLWIVSRAGRLGRSALVMIWVGTAVLALWQTLSRYRLPIVIAQLPGGTAAIDPPAYDKLHWIMEHTQPGQFFFQAGWPGVYLPLGLRNPVYVEDVGPTNKTRPEDITSTVRLLEEKRVQYILWPARLDFQDELAGRSKVHVITLRAYVHSRYTQVQIFRDGDSVWRRNE